MEESPPSPVRRHSVAAEPARASHSSEGSDVFEHSQRARFSFDIDPPDHDDPLDLNEYVRVHPPQQSLYRRLLPVLVLILMWYSFSLLLSLYNKWMFSTGHLDFPFPLFVTSLHMIVQFCLSGLVLWWLPQFRPTREKYLSFRDYTYGPY
jgi:hypothetical protein